MKKLAQETNFNAASTMKAKAFIGNIVRYFISVYEHAFKIYSEQQPLALFKRQSIQVGKNDRSMI